ncbi:cytochrome P450 [Umbelopsis sp. AD052]|nr:cytochrome P450 [Umbelopsis sp. AD052]
MQVSIDSMISRLLQARHGVLDNVIYYSGKQPKATYIATAITLYIGTKIYNVMSCPNTLRHIAYVPAPLWMFSLMRGETTLDRTKRLLISRMTETNGMVSKFSQLGWEVTVMNPKAIKTLLQRTDLFPKSEVTIDNFDSRSLIRRYFGKTNLTLANGHEWMRRRKIANPAFKRALPVKMFARLTSQASEQLDLSNGAPVMIAPMMQRFTLDVIGLAGFGFDLNSISSPDGQWVTAYNEVADGFMAFPFIFLPVLETEFIHFFPNRRKKHEQLSKLDGLFESIIEHKRETLKNAKPESVDDNEKDLLTLLMEAGRGEDHDSEPLTNQELRDELVLFFFAGHDTTSHALACALYYLAVNPDIQEKARQEVIDVLGDTQEENYPTIQQLRQLPYLTRVMKETLRIASPPVNLVQRIAQHDTELEGVVIPKDTLLTVDFYAIHHNPHLWITPEVFDPDRFNEGGELDCMDSSYAYLPFGGGGRQCIAMTFSIAEQKVVLSGLLRNYDISLPENSIHKHSLQFRPSTGLIVPTKDLELKFVRRNLVF